MEVDGLLAIPDAEPGVVQSQAVALVALGGIIKIPQTIPASKKVSGGTAWSYALVIVQVTV